MDAVSKEFSCVAHIPKIFASIGGSEMRLLLGSLLLRYTKCSVRIVGTTVCLVWEFTDNTIVWSLHASKNMRVSVIDNKLRLVKFNPKVKKLIKS